jgi:hypothetical protein
VDDASKLQPHFAGELPKLPPLVADITNFLHGIGLEVRAGGVEEKTALPGITVSRGVLIFDPAKLKFPGDLLHEAGHLAVKTPTERSQCMADTGNDPAEEMMAIAWSYAAVIHLGLPPETVFHTDGYRGGSKSLLENFAEGRYLAVPMLQWIGLAHDEKRAREAGSAAYPKMVRWLRGE